MSLISCLHSSLTSTSLGYSTSILEIFYTAWQKSDCVKKGAASVTYVHKLSVPVCLPLLFIIFYIEREPSVYHREKCDAAAPYINHLKRIAVAQ